MMNPFLFTLTAGGSFTPVRYLTVCVTFKNLWNSPPNHVNDLCYFILPHVVCYFFSCTDFFFFSFMGDKMCCVPFQLTDG